MQAKDIPKTTQKISMLEYALAFFKRCKTEMLLSSKWLGNQANQKRPLLTVCQHLANSQDANGLVSHEQGDADGLEVKSIGQGLDLGLSYAR